MIEFFNGKSNDIINPCLELKYKPDPFQNYAFNKIEEGHDIFVSVPTSSGKTIIGIYGIANTIKKHNKRAIYTTPIKTLSNEKYNEFKNEFDSVGIITGDNKINVDAQCLIMTAEILRNLLYTNIEFIQSIGCVVIDEIHFMNDLERGSVWEETLIMLNKNIQLIMLSATINEPVLFCNWITKIRGNKLALIELHKRIIPLNHYIFVNNQLILFFNNETFLFDNIMNCKEKYNEIKKQKKQPNSIKKLINYLKNEQTIIFSFSRNKCEEYALQVQTSLITYIEREEINIYYNKYFKDNLYETNEQFIMLKKLIYDGIAFHHSGVLAILREFIEILFKKSLIKMLFATETFAIGVNTPTKNVVFTNLYKYINGTYTLLTPSEYKQISGRAGRRGIDTTGTVIILPLNDFPDVNDLRILTQGKIASIKSTFDITYQFCLKHLNDGNIFIINSLFNNITNDNIPYFDYTYTKCLEFLTKLNYIENNQLTIKGIIASKINECDPLLLTELLTNNIFDDMDIHEIIALVSIFTEPCNYIEFQNMPIFNDKIDQITKIINTIYDLELQIFNNNITYYNLNYEYFKICLDWTKNSSLIYVNQVEVFIGDFVKKMIKIHNIIEDIKYLCEILHKNELIQKLTLSVGLILKGIVNINSIYLL